MEVAFGPSEWLRETELTGSLDPHMNFLRSIWGVCVIVVLLGLIGFLGFQQKKQTAQIAQIAEAERKAATLQAKVTELRLQVERLERPNTATSSGNSSLSPAAVVPTAASSAHALVAAMPISVSGMQSANPFGALWSLRGNPAAMRAWIEAQPAALQLQLGPLFEKLKLSPSQIDQLKAAMIEKYQTLADVLIAGATKGVSESDPVIKDLIKESNLKTENSLHALLGDAGYQEMRRFGDTVAVRDVVKSVASDTYSTSSPLTSAQSEQLIQIISESSVKSSSGYDVRTTDWTAVLERAQHVLTPVQLAMLRAEKDQLLLKQRLIDLERTGTATKH